MYYFCNIKNDRTPYDENKTLYSDSDDTDVWTKPDGCSEDPQRACRGA